MNTASITEKLNTVAANPFVQKAKAVANSKPVVVAAQVGVGAVGLGVAYALFAKAASATYAALS